MKKLTEEYEVVKVDALNCDDCLLGGKGKVLEADPDHNLLFLYPGMIGFFRHFEEKQSKKTSMKSHLTRFSQGLSESLF